jgi:DNA-binding winged helix-turn-helix (wHTH) protein
MELAQLYSDRCDYGVAISKFKEAAEIYYKERDFEQYLNCHNKLLKIYAQREDHDAIQATKEHFQDLVLKEGFELNAKTYYFLGVCASYKNQADVALDYFQKSLTVSLASDNKEDICHSIYGLANTYGMIGRYSEALKEIYNLQVFFQVISLPEVELASRMLNASVLSELKKYDQALELYWSCYDTLRAEKNLYFYIFLLFSMGKTYKLMGEAGMARMYLKLAQRSADPENLRYLCRYIEKNLLELGISSGDEYDLVLNAVSNSVTERKKGRVDFKNQFILLDMLRVFMDQPGKVYSKENLVKTVWKQDYDPATHDNKIYVTIKRLRKLIEPDYDKPKYIFRAKNGYYLNKSAKILLEQ